MNLYLYGFCGHEQAGPAHDTGLGRCLKLSPFFVGLTCYSSNVQVKSQVIE